MHRKALYVIVTDPAELNTPASAADIAGTGFTGSGGASWESVTGKPSTFPPDIHTHDYANLTNKPALFDGTWASLSGKPLTFAPSAHNHDASYAAISHTHDYSTLTNKPTLFDGTWASLTGKPSTFAPSAHTHAPSEITGTAVVTADSRLSDARKPAYVTGDGGTVTQATSKATGVTLSKLCGTITMNAAALAAGATVSFTVTNTLVAATDVVCIQHDSVGAIGSYTVVPNTMAAGSFKVSVRNNSAASLSEAIVLRFAVVKAVVS